MTSLELTWMMVSRLSSRWSWLRVMTSSFAAGSARSRPSGLVELTSSTLRRPNTPSAQRERPAPESDEQTEEYDLDEADHAEQKEDGIVGTFGHRRVGIAVASGAGVESGHEKKHDHEQMEDGLQPVQARMTG